MRSFSSAGLGDRYWAASTPPSERHSFAQLSPACGLRHSRTLVAFSRRNDGARGQVLDNIPAASFFNDEQEDSPVPAPSELSLSHQDAAHQANNNLVLQVLPLHLPPPTRAPSHVPSHATDATVARY